MKVRLSPDLDFDYREATLDAIFDNGRMVILGKNNFDKAKTAQDFMRAIKSLILEKHKADIIL